MDESQSFLFDKSATMAPPSSPVVEAPQNHADTVDPQVDILTKEQSDLPAHPSMSSNDSITTVEFQCPECQALQREAVANGNPETPLAFCETKVQGTTSLPCVSIFTDSDLFADATEAPTEACDIVTEHLGLGSPAVSEQPSATSPFEISPALLHLLQPFVEEHSEGTDFIGSPPLTSNSNLPTDVLTPLTEVESIELSAASSSPFFSKLPSPVFAVEEDSPLASLAPSSAPTSAWRAIEPSILHSKQIEKVKAQVKAPSGDKKFSFEDSLPQLTNDDIYLMSKTRGGKKIIFRRQIVHLDRSLPQTIHPSREESRLQSGIGKTCAKTRAVDSDLDKSQDDDYNEADESFFLAEEMDKRAKSAKGKKHTRSSKKTRVSLQPKIQPCIPCPSGSASRVKHAQNQCTWLNTLVNTLSAKGDEKSNWQQELDACIGCRRQLTLVDGEVSQPNASSICVISFWPTSSKAADSGKQRGKKKKPKKVRMDYSKVEVFINLDTSCVDWAPAILERLQSLAMATSGLTDSPKVSGSNLRILIVILDHDTKETQEIYAMLKRASSSMFDFVWWRSPSGHIQKQAPGFMSSVVTHVYVKKLWRKDGTLNLKALSRSV